MTSRIKNIIKTGTFDEVAALARQLSALVSMSTTGDGPKITKLAAIYLRRAQRKLRKLGGPSHD